MRGHELVSKIDTLAIGLDGDEVVEAVTIADATAAFGDGCAVEFALAGAAAVEGNAFYLNAHCDFEGGGGRWERLQIEGNA